MTAHVHRRTTFAIGALLALTIADGCSAGSPPTTAPPPNNAAATTTAATGAVDVCAILPAATVASLTGQTYAGGQSSDIASGVYSCVYSPDNGGYGLSATVYAPSSGSVLNDLVTDLGGSSVATPVSGVGETAYAAKLGVVAKAGPWLVEVGSPAIAAAPDSAETGYIAVAKALIAALH